jgi:hypothetical protein
MHSDRELTRLAAHKAALRRSIGRHRAQCVAAAGRALQPLAWVDRMIVLWRKLSPFAQFVAVPLGFLLKRSPAPRPRLLGTLLRWAPMVLGAVRGLAGSRR